MQDPRPKTENHGFSAGAMPGDTRTGYEGAHAALPTKVRPKILIVDDREENLIATEALLRSLKAEIIVASSGNEALALMLSHRFAVVLLDVQMPVMDGFETAELMQEHETMRGVPIIFVTAISKDDRYATQAAKLGAVDYVFKPVNVDVLRSKVKVYLDLYVQREQILHLNAGLQQAQKMEAIGNLTGGMAHDFNNLLSIIIGNLDMLNEKLVDQEAKNLSQAALEAALRGADLTRRLLAFARQQPLQTQRIDINMLVQEIAKLLERTLGQHIRIVLNLAPDVWPIIADPVQLEAALTNLTTNARDAMPQGGRLTISTHSGYLDADYVAQYDDDILAGDYAVIEVSDTGSGMPPEVIARIFEPFFTTKERGKGTGLGLAMIFGFMKQSGGHVNVYSEVGSGTTFRLYFPRVVTEEKATVESAAPSASKGGHETILVVEDNDEIRKIVKQQLDALGYRVMEADSADAALELLKPENKISLLFSDIVMPGEYNGLDLARMAVERLPSLKILLTSGFPETKLNNGGEKAIGMRLLSKPYRKADLARVLREVLE